MGNIFGFQNKPVTEDVPEPTYNFKRGKELQKSPKLEIITPDKNYIDQLPLEMKILVLTLLTESEASRMSMTCKSWNLIFKNQILWQQRLKQYFPDCFRQYTAGEFRIDAKSPESSWQEAYMHCYLEGDLRWDETIFGSFSVPRKSSLLFWDNGRSVRHRDGIRYIAVRTTRGFTSGKKYWGIKLLGCTYNGYNTYVGVSSKHLTTSLHLGYDIESWGLKGGDGGFYHGGRAIKSGLFKRTLRNGDIVMVCLDLDNCTITYSLNGEISPTICCPEFKGMEVFPAVSLIEDSDAIAAVFGMRSVDFTHLDDKLWSTKVKTEKLSET